MTWWAGDPWRGPAVGGPLLVHVHHLGRREAVEPGGRRVAVGADVLGVDQVVDLEGGQVLGVRDRVEPVAGLAEHGADLGPALA